MSSTDTKEAAGAAGPGASVLPAPPPESGFRRFLSDFCESRIAVGAALIFAIIVFLAVFAPWIAPQDPYDLATVSIFDARMPPGAESMDGYTFWLGTDGAGRDLNCQH